MVNLSIDSKSMAMKNGQSVSGSIRLPHLMLKHLRNFQELHPRVHHHLLHPGGSDLLLQFVENDMVNHEGKANRRFPRRVQVRIHASGNDGVRTINLV